MTPEQTADFLHRLISQLEASSAALRGFVVRGVGSGLGPEGVNRLGALCNRNDSLLGEIGRVQLADNPPGFSELLG